MYGSLMAVGLSRRYTGRFYTEISKPGTISSENLLEGLVATDYAKPGAKELIQCGQDIAIQTDVWSKHMYDPSQKPTLKKPRT